MKITREEIEKYIIIKTYIYRVDNNTDADL